MILNILRGSVLYISPVEFSQRYQTGITFFRGSSCKPVLQFQLEGFKLNTSIYIILHLRKSLLIYEPFSYGWNDSDKLDTIFLHVLSSSSLAILEALGIESQVLLSIRVRLKPES